MQRSWPDSRPDDEFLVDTAFARLGAVVWVFDLDGVCLWASPSARTVIGLLPDELIGTRPQVHWTDFRLRESVGLGPFRHQVVSGDGTNRWVESEVDSDGQGRTTVTMRDVTKEVQAEQRLAASLQSGLEPHAYLEAVRADDGSFVDFVVKEANTAARESFGIEPGVHLREVLSKGVGGRALLAMLAQVADSGQSLALDEHEFPGQDDIGRRFDIRAVKVGDGLSLDWREVTDRVRAARALAASEEHFRLLAESIGDVVRAFDLQGIHQWVSPSVHALLGYTPDELIGTSAVELMHPEDVEAVYSHGTRVAEKGGTVPPPRRTRLRHADGHWVWTETTNSFRFGPDGTLLQVYAVSRDAEAQVRAEQELQRMAQTDPLTGLLNRASILSRLATIAERITEAEPPAALLFCDIDDLKQINDSLGHAAGDAVITAIARRLDELCDDSALIARFGGDELLVVLPRVRDLDETVATAERLRQGVLELDLHDGLPVSVSMGVALIRSGEAVDQVIARADHAMYAAKSSGRNAVVAAD